MLGVALVFALAAPVVVCAYDAEAHTRGATRSKQWFTIEGRAVRVDARAGRLTVQADAATVQQVGETFSTMIPSPARETLTTVRISPRATVVEHVGAASEKRELRDLELNQRVTVDGHIVHDAGAEPDWVAELITLRPADWTG